MTPITTTSVGSALVAGSPNRAQRKQVKIKVERRFRFSGRTADVGEILTVDHAFAMEMVAAELASYFTPPPDPPVKAEPKQVKGRWEKGTKKPLVKD